MVNSLELKTVMAAFLLGVTVGSVFVIILQSLFRKAKH